MGVHACLVSQQRVKKTRATGGVAFASRTPVSWAWNVSTGVGSQLWSPPVAVVCRIDRSLCTKRFYRGYSLSLTETGGTM